MSAWLVVAGVCLAAVSGVPGLLCDRASRGGERLAAALLLLAGIAGVAGSALAIANGPSTIDLPWQVPGGAFGIRIDAIAAMFLLSIFVIAPLNAVYGLGYWPQAEHPRDGRKLRLFYGLLVAGMALLVAASNTMLFLGGWEMMALAAFLTLTAQDDQPEVREVGYIYLVATRLGTLCLFAFFALLFVARGDFTFAPVAAGTTPFIANTIFLTGLVGFSLKAGVMPLHVWLPGAHANAPSHVSALLSGVLLKLGIYGLVRLGALLPDPPAWWGVTVLALGAISGVLGVAFAIGQHDLKRLLAYHSVENIGIILLGLGLALLGRSIGNPLLIVLGLSGALLHVWNHGLFKALLFLAAGSVLHATGTREIDQLGGLARKLPLTALGFLVGAVAICGLPPLNGFVSELLIYLGLFRAAASHQALLWLSGALVAPALSLIGALALACFTKAYGAVFLGEARTERGAHAHEAGGRMLLPMALLGLACVVIGLFPPLLTPVLDSAVAAFAPGRLPAPLADLAPLGYVSAVAAALWLALLAAGWLLLRRVRSAEISVPTWDCGYAAPTATMQYTSSSFAQSVVGLFAFALRPDVHPPHLSTSPFPKPASFESHVADVVLDKTILPLGKRLGDGATWLKGFQRGASQTYVLFVLLTLLALLLWRT